MAAISAATPAFRFSIGRDKYDNRPVQRVCMGFNEFIAAILDSPPREKHKTYVCAAMALGAHDDAEKFPGEAHYRLKSKAQPRRFLALDCDGFASVDAYERLKEIVSRWSVLVYTTASHTQEKPRARVLIELDRDVTPDEGENLGFAVQAHIEGEIGPGQIKFDPSVYKAAQPVYTPLAQAEVFRGEGAAVSVEAMLRAHQARTMDRHGTFGMLDHLVQPGGFSWPEGSVREPNRNNTMLAYAGHLRARGYAEGDILALALHENQARFRPPLDEKEVVDVCGRYARRAAGFLASPAAALAANDGYFDVPEKAPPPREYVLGQQVTAGTVCVLGGSGGTMKTMLMLQMAVAAAVGRDLLGDLRVGQGASLVFLGEEDSAERDRRFGAICAHFGADRALVARRVMCFGAAGSDLRLTHLVNGMPEATPLVEKVIELAREHAGRAGAPLRYIVFDHARLVLGGDPNSAEHVTQLTRVLTHIARTTGAAVFLLAHSPKTAIGKEGHEMNAGDVAGSSAFVDNARTGFIQWTMRDGEARKLHIQGDRKRFVRIEVKKANYGLPDVGWWFKKEPVDGWDMAVLQFLRLSSSIPFEGKEQSALRQRIMELVRKKPGGLTERRVRDFAGKDRELEASEGRVRAEVTSMIEEGILVNRPPTGEERRRYKFGPQVRAVLDASAAHVG